ncbi:unnamed protein product [Leptosia nina]|uniref:U1-type domain-containing protein n=1 Tax=Leptosia nina TaxID=320188 RepID=A0AAV1JGT6_9NEOP
MFTIFIPLRFLQPWSNICYLHLYTDLNYLLTIITRKTSFDSWCVKMDYDDDDFYEYPDDLEHSLGPPPPLMSENMFGNRYQNAYGLYSGGYGPMGREMGRFGPPGFPGPPLGFGPPMPYPGPRGPGLWAKGPPFPSRPQKNEAIKYLIKCGVPREHLRNLPRDLLELITPKYCGLCAVEFETFVLARVHYISKNHLKNQKKWQVNQGQLNNASRAPLKSRDLYCELCDVEITSKTHSESHYSGKAHKSIVEGRKKPKNPILLQPGMEDRVKNLIRREKKFVHMSEPSEPAAPSNADELAKVPPELHCAICKTFVTCSEQMTLHLNGKKHLNKEKQHILRMMKGEQTGNDAMPKASAVAEGDLLLALDVELEKLPPIEDQEDRRDDSVNKTSTEQAENVSSDWDNDYGTWDEPETLN